MTPEARQKKIEYKREWDARNNERVKREAREKYAANKEEICASRRVENMTDEQKEVNREKWRMAKAEARSKRPEHFREMNRADYHKYKNTRPPQKINKAYRVAYLKKWREDLPDSYIANSLNMPVTQVPAEIIEAKRQVLKTKRILKQIKKQIDENTNE